MLEYLICLFSWAVLELRTLGIKEGGCRALKLFALQQITSFRLHMSVLFHFIDASSESQTVKAGCRHSLLSLPEMWPWKAEVRLCKHPHHTHQHNLHAPSPHTSDGLLVASDRACDLKTSQVTFAVSQMQLMGNPGTHFKVNYMEQINQSASEVLLCLWKHWLSDGIFKGIFIHSNWVDLKNQTKTKNKPKEQLNKKTPTPVMWVSA